MKYLEILREDDAVVATPDAATATPTAPVEKPATKVFYHVTTKARMRSIQELGIKPNHNRRWKTGFGVQLGDRGKIYLMSDFTAAVRWAHKTQWEHFHGKTPAKSPYVIVCVREDPNNLEPDPHPENGLYGHTWFQKTGTIEPQNIMKVIPLTPALVKQIVNGGTAIQEAIGSHYNARDCHHALISKGWEETSAFGMYENPEYPEYAIEVNIHSPDGGPFTVYRGGHIISKMAVPPFAQQLGLKDRLI